MEKDHCLIAALICMVVIVMACLLMSCNSLPKKQSNMELGEKTYAPKGYRDMKVREAVDKVLKEKGLK